MVALCVIRSSAATLLLVAVSATAQISDGEFEDEIARLWARRTKGPYLVEPSRVTELLAWIDKRSANALDFEKENLEGNRIVLGEEAAIKRAFASGLAMRYRNEIIWSGSPIAVELLAKDLSRDEKLKYEMDGDVPIVTRSYAVAAGDLPGAMMRCAEFNAEVVDWAVAYRHSTVFMRYEQMLPVMRTWWLDNKEKFARHLYREVTPPKLLLISRSDAERGGRRVGAPVGDGTIENSDVLPRKATSEN